MRRRIASALARGAMGALLGIALGVSPMFDSAAEAGEVQLGVESQYAYTSNFFSTTRQEEDASAFQLGPLVRINDNEGRFLYDLNFAGAYQLYVDQDDADAWESRLRARFDYILTPRTTIRVNENFRDISNLRFGRDDLATADTALDPIQDRYFRNDLELELLHEVTRNLEMRINASHHWVDFDRNIDRNDSQSFEVGSEFRYRILPAHRVGVEAAYVDQNFEKALSRIGSRGQYLSAAANWIWNINRAWEFRANGGPAWIRSVEDNQTTTTQRQFVGGRLNGEETRANILSCASNIPATPFLASRCDFNTANVAPIPGGLGPEQVFTLENRGRVRRDTSVTFFGGASIRGDVENWTLSAGYSRTQATATGDGLATSLDHVEFEVEFHPERGRWSTYAAFNFDRRESLTEATVIDFEVSDPGDGSAERGTAFTAKASRRESRDNYTAIAGVRGAYDRHTEGSFEFRYRHFRNNDSNIDADPVDIFFAILTVRYNLDPFRF